MYSMTADLSIGLAEIVECVFDRKGAPASLLGVPIDKTVPDYCEVSHSYSPGVLLSFPVRHKKCVVQ